MNLGLSEEQELLKKSARDFLKSRCPKSLVRKLEESDSGYSREIWHEMAELGWLGLTFPEEFGGVGGSFLDSAVLHEEIGRAALPCPYLSTVDICGQIILTCGTEEQKKEFVPKVAKGDMILALALNEPEVSFAGPIRVESVLAKNDYVINGTKLFVSSGHVADYLLCVTKSNSEKNSNDGISLFLVDAKSHGITFTLLKTMGGDKQSEVTFSNVMVPKKNMLGEPGKMKAPFMKALQPAMVMECAQMVGGAQMILEMSVDYAKQRIQFGRPIGSFQAIQHKCADMVQSLEGARLMTWAAAWKLDQDLSCIKDVAMAKSYTNATCRRVAWEGHQIHAGIAFMKDHDLQLYTRRAAAGEQSLGDTEFHQHIIAREMSLVDTVKMPI